MATLDGNAVFGAVDAVRVDESPRDAQENTFPGVDGIERLDSGARGRRIQVNGWLEGPGPAGLAAAQQSLRAFRDGAAHVLVDNMGLVWTNVVLESVQIDGDMYLGSDMICCQRYTAELKQLL